MKAECMRLCCSFDGVIQTIIIIRLFCVSWGFMFAYVFLYLVTENLKL